MKKFLALGMVALIAVTAFAVGFTAMASAETPGEGTVSDEAPAGGWMVHRELGVLNAKVADILGIDEEELADAFKQAWQEVKDDIGEVINHKDAVNAKVADILGVDEEQLANAFKQAWQEVKDDIGEVVDPRDAVNAKVAEILGVDEEELADALQQAWQEVRDDIGEGVKPKDAILTKVAEILGISVEQLTDATEQAREELKAEAQERIQERQEERLQNAVENGIITEDEANQIREWWQNRPAALDKLRPVNRLRHHMPPGPMQEEPGSSGELPMQNSRQNRFQYQNQLQDI